jgi:hypothetical protein
MDEKYFNEYKKNLKFDLQKAFDNLGDGKKIDIKRLMFESAFFSSGISGMYSKIIKDKTKKVKTKNK